MFDLEDLQAFIAVADAGGITPGAGRLGVSKSVVSRRLARLENQFGVLLLSRTTRGAALTEAGVMFRDHAARAVAELDEARDALSSTGDIRGVLRIAAPLSYGQTHLAPILARLAAENPRLHVHTSYSDHLVDIVGAGFDAAIRIGYLADSSLVARRIRSIEARIVASPDYIARFGAPQSLDELSTHEALLLRSDSWPVSIDGKLARVRPRGRFQADNGVAIAAAAVAGLGVAQLPDFLADTHIANGALAPILAEYAPPAAAVHVVRPPGPHASRKVTALIDLLLAELGDSRG